MRIKATRELPDDIDITKLVDYRHGSDSCIDLITCHYVCIEPRRSALINTGVAIELPSATMGLILPRSGLATREVAVLGGVIDEGYRGELIVNLINHGSQSIEFPVGSRVAQLLVLPYYHAKLEWVDELSKSDRGTAGHGSTGL